MPVPALKSIAKKSGKSLDEIEKYWKAAKKSAEDAGEKDNYAYIMSIVQKRAGMKESLENKLDKLIGESLAGLLPKISRAFGMDELQVEAAKPKKGDKVNMIGDKVPGKINKVSRGYVYIDYGVKGYFTPYPISGLKPSKTKGEWTSK